MLCLKFDEKYWIIAPLKMRWAVWPLLSFASKPCMVGLGVSLIQSLCTFFFKFFIRAEYCLGDALRTTRTDPLQGFLSFFHFFFLNSIFPLLLPLCRFNLSSPGHSGLQIQKINCWREKKNLVPEIYFSKKKGYLAVWCRQHEAVPKTTTDS